MCRDDEKTKKNEWSCGEEQLSVREFYFLYLENFWSEMKSDNPNTSSLNESENHGYGGRSEGKIGSFCGARVTIRRRDFPISSTECQPPLFNVKILCAPYEKNHDPFIAYKATSVWN